MTNQPPPPPTQGQWPQQGPPPGYYAQPAKKKSVFTRVWFWLIVVAVLFMAGCTAFVALVVNAVDDAVNSEHTVVYAVSGDGTKTSVTYTTFNGDGSSGTQQEGEAALPFSKELTGKGDFSVYSLVAQAGDGNTITCSITIDGKLVIEQTSTGQYSVVTCSGSPPDSD